MRKGYTSFGDNAGKIWHSISNNGKQSIDEIVKNANLNTEEIYSGIGWLAREDKIKKNNQTYSLGNTNLTSEIGSIAGKVYKILDIWEEADIETLKKLANENNENVYSALGWLAREDKIIHEDENKYSLKI